MLFPYLGVTIPMTGSFLLIVCILLALGAELDLDYIEMWAERLSVISLWREVQAQARSRT